MQEIELAGCPVCSGAARAWASVASDHGRFAVVRCRDCGFAFVNPRPDRAFLVDYYAGSGGETPVPDLQAALLEEERHPNSSVDAERMLRILGSLLSDSGAPRRLLDLGCGQGFFSREALRCGFRVTALEIAAAERALTEQMTGIRPRATTFEDFEDEPGAYGAVLMSQVLEHAFDVNEWVAKAAALLAPGGVLGVALPNFDGLPRRLLGARDPFITPPEHLNFFSPRSLRRLLEGHGLRVEGMQWVSRLPLDAVARRLRIPERALARLPFGLAFRALDACRLGIMINAYARRAEQNSMREWKR